MSVKLETRNLKAGYGDLVILKDVSMRVEKGEIRIILGGSGCGKSTLLKNIIGLERPLGGQIFFLGTELNWSEDGLPADLMRKIGVLFQSSALLSSLTVGENVALPLRVHHPGLPDSVIEELVRSKLELVDLGHAYYKLPNELSGGMKKRAGLARAIVTDPELLFFDEPSAGLDPLTSRGLDDLLISLRDTLGITLVVVTHELESIRTLCDKMTYLSQGSVLFDGSLTEARENGPDEVRKFLGRESGSGVARSPKLAFHLED